MNTVHASLYECSIPCDEGDITVYQLDNNSWWVDFTELAHAIGLDAEKLATDIREIVAKEPGKFKDPFITAHSFQTNKKGEYCIKNIELIALEPTVAILVGETAVGNLFAGKLTTQTLFYALMATFQALANESKKDDSNDD